MVNNSSNNIENHKERAPLKTMKASRTQRENEHRENEEKTINEMIYPYARTTKKLKLNVLSTGQIIHHDTGLTRFSMSSKCERCK